MNIIQSVIAGVATIVGIVIFYTIYDQFKDNLGAAAGLLLVVPIVLAATALLAILIGGFGR